MNGLRIADPTDCVDTPEVVAGLPRFVSSGEFARSLGCSPAWVHRLVSSRAITPDAYTGPVRHVGGRLRVGGYLFRPETVSSFLEARALPGRPRRSGGRGAPRQLYLPLLIPGGRR